MRSIGIKAVRALKIPDARAVEPSHSIAASARTSSVGSTLSPGARAVLSLTTISNLVGLRPAGRPALPRAGPRNRRRYIRTPGRAVGAGQGHRPRKYISFVN
jgi:hypothetical protein